MAWSRVASQNASTTASGVTTLSVSLTSNPTKGNLVVVGGLCDHNTTLTCKDGAATPNNYTATPNSPSAFGAIGALVGVYYLENAPSTANKTVTLTAGTASFLGIWVQEVTCGQAAVGVFERDAQDTTHAAQSEVVSPSITTTNAGDYIFNITGSGSNVTAVNTATFAWVLVNAIRSGNGCEDIIQTNAGAIHADWNQDASVQWVGVIAAFSLPLPPTPLRTRAWDEEAAPNWEPRRNIALLQPSAAAPVVPVLHPPVPEETEFSAWRPSANIALDPPTVAPTPAITTRRILPPPEEVEFSAWRPPRNIALAPPTQAATPPNHISRAPEPPPEDVEFAPWRAPRNIALVPPSPAATPPLKPRVLWGVPDTESEVANWQPPRNIVPGAAPPIRPRVLWGVPDTDSEVGNWIPPRNIVLAPPAPAATPPNHVSRAPQPPPEDVEFAPWRAPRNIALATPTPAAAPQITPVIRHGAADDDVTSWLPERNVALLQPAQQNPVTPTITRSAAEDDVAIWRAPRNIALVPPTPAAAPAITPLIRASASEDDVTPWRSIRDVALLQPTATQPPFTILPRPEPGDDDVSTSPPKSNIALLSSSGPFAPLQRRQVGDDDVAMPRVGPNVALLEQPTVKPPGQPSRPLQSAEDDISARPLPDRNVALLQPVTANPFVPVSRPQPGDEDVSTRSGAPNLALLFAPAPAAQVQPLAPRPQPSDEVDVTRWQSPYNLALLTTPVPIPPPVVAPPPGGGKRRRRFIVTKTTVLPATPVEPVAQVIEQVTGAPPSQALLDVLGKPITALAVMPEPRRGRKKSPLVAPIVVIPDDVPVVAPPAAELPSLPPFSSVLAAPDEVVPRLEPEEHSHESELPDESESHIDQRVLDALTLAQRASMANEVLEKKIAALAENHAREHALLWGETALEIATLKSTIARIEQLRSQETKDRHRAAREARARDDEDAMTILQQVWDDERKMLSSAIDKIVSEFE